jgi:hypothetical protein
VPCRSISNSCRIARPGHAWFQDRTSSTDTHAITSTAHRRTSLKFSTKSAVRNHYKAEVQRGCITPRVNRHGHVNFAAYPRIRDAGARRCIDSASETTLATMDASSLSVRGRKCRHHVAATSHIRVDLRANSHRKRSRINKLAFSGVRTYTFPETFLTNWSDELRGICFPNSLQFVHWSDPASRLNRQRFKTS